MRNQPPNRVNQQAAVPVIDLEGLRAGDCDATKTVVEQVSHACQNTGFFQVSGHGIDNRLIERMFAVSGEFFDLPRATKNHIEQAGPVPGGLMYCPLMTETLAGSLGEAAPGDLKENLDFGPGFYGVDWPTEPTQLRSTWHEYYGALSTLAGELRRVFALAIGLPENYFEPLFDKHLSSLRVLNYPASTPAPGQLRAGAHSDYGFLTILRAGAGSSGLEIRHVNGAWTEIDCLADGFVINLGDAMMRWTNDHWQSSVHRVSNPPAGSQPRRRQSVAFFHNPNAQAVIDVFDAFCKADEPKRHAPISYHDYAHQKYRQTHGDDAPNPFQPSLTSGQ